MTTTETSTQTQTISYRKLNDEWTLFGPVDALRILGAQVTVSKRDGSTKVETCGSLIDGTVVRIGTEVFCQAQIAKTPRATAGQPLPEVPEGFYAVTSRTGNNDLDFFSVDRPSEGRWAGYVFVKRVIGGHEDTPVRGAEARQALEAIASAGISESQALYGIEIGRCGVCNRHLTDEVSRSLGIGPTCRGRG